MRLRRNDPLIDRGIEGMNTAARSGANDSDPGPKPLNAPRIRSLGEIQRALQIERPRLVRGQLSALALLNGCFLDGTLTKSSIESIASRDRSVAQEIGLTKDAADALAEFGYTLYQQQEFLGAVTFWEAMTMLNGSDAYFHNMLGASLEGLGRREAARDAYAKALKLDPSNEHAAQNLQRLVERD